MTSTESEKLGRFALDLTLDAIPDDVLTLAKEHFLDALGIALASSKFDFGEAILNGARALGDGTQATAIGSGVRLPAPSAALVNGVLARPASTSTTPISAPSIMPPRPRSRLPLPPAKLTARAAPKS